MSLTDGANVAVVLLYATVPVIPPLNVNVDSPTVPASISSLKVAVISLITGDTSVAPSAGLGPVITGAVVSKIIESLAVSDILFTASLYQTYTVLLPSPLLKVYEMFLAKFVDASADTQFESDDDGVVDAVDIK